MKRKGLILSFSAVLFACCCMPSHAFIFRKKQQEVNPDYTQTYYDKLMQQQSFSDMARGMYYMNLSRYDDAVEAFAKAVFKNPKEPYAYVLFGSALYWTGKVDAAIAEYKRAVKLDEKNADANQLLGIAYGWKGDIKTAKEYFEKADKLSSDRPDVKMNLSSVYASLGDLPSAIDYARKAVNISPRYPLYHYNLGSLLERRGLDEQAAESFKKAIKLFPRYEDSMLALAAMYEKRAEVPEAASYYKKAINTKPKDHVARLRYANLLYVNGEKDKAKDVLEDAFSISENSGKGLALSVAYAAGDAKANGANKDIENLKKSLSQMPAEDNVMVEVELSFTPKMKTDLQMQTETPLLTKELERHLEGKKADSGERVFKRSFVFNAESPAARAAHIEALGQALEQSFNEKKDNEDMKINIKASSSQSTAGPAAASSDQKTAYNPRSVGNDTGLWVTGRSWVKYVEEVLPEIENRIYDSGGKDAQDYILLGLAYLTLGNGAEAERRFNLAAERGEKETALLGLGTAMIVQGNEPAAKQYYEDVLLINPKNKTAINNLKQLKK